MRTPLPQRASEAEAPPTTTAEALARSGPSRDARQQVAARALQLFEALTTEGRATEIAAIVVVREDGREVEPGEVEADGFPSAVFLESYLSFMTASNELTAGLLGLPGATGSTGATPTPTPTSRS